MQKTPTKIQFHQQSQQLELHFGAQIFLFPSEFLRVHSPSAEVKGHGPNQEVLQVGKKDVSIKKIERAGNYALKLIFTDSHETGIYTWEYFYELGNNQEQLWEVYLKKLRAAGQVREKDTQVVKFI